MSKVAIIRTSDRRGNNRIQTLFQIEGYALHGVSRGMFGHRRFVAFDGCYMNSDGDVITVEDIQEQHQPATKEEIEEFEEQDKRRKPLDKPVTIEFVDQFTKEIMTERLLDEGHALDPLSEQEHGHAKFKAFNDSWNPSEKSTIVTLSDIPEQYRPDSTLETKIV